MIFVIVLVVLVVLVVVFFVGTYNGLVRLRNKIDAAWAQIDVQLKRRFDLIPNLVETVKGYAAHEQRDLRGRHPGPQHGHERPGPGRGRRQADNVLTGALKSLFAVSEAYPDLKANQNFLDLQEELTGTEDKISYAAAVLQRHRAQLQHQDPVRPGQHHRRGVPLREAGVLRGRRRLTGSRQGQLLRQAAARSIARRSPPCTTRSSRTSAVLRCSSSCFIALVVVGGDAFDSSSSSAGRRRLRACVLRRRRVVRLVLELRQGGAGPEPRRAGRPRRPTPGSTTWSRGCASPAACPSRRSTSSTTRPPTPSPPAAIRSTPSIAVTTGLLEKMNRVELEGVLAHELSHVKNYDILVSSIAVCLVGVVAALSDFGIRMFIFGGGRRRQQQQQRRRRRQRHRDGAGASW